MKDHYRLHVAERISLWLLPLIVALDCFAPTWSDLAPPHFHLSPIPESEKGFSWNMFVMESIK